MAKPIGRPSLYKPEYCEALIKHMSEGLSFETFCLTIGVSYDTPWEWAKVHPDFSEAKKIAVAACQMYWEKLGRDHILNESFGGNQGSKSLNASAWIFNMKNRFRWRDKQPDEEVQTQVNVNVSTELIEKLKAEIKARK